MTAYILRRLIMLVPVLVVVGVVVFALVHLTPGDPAAVILGDRATPDAVAARLHHLALVVGDLAGSYNDIGIRRWFRRKRSQLDGQPPAALLARDWDPDDEGPRRVRELARSLVDLAAT